MAGHGEGQLAREGGFERERPVVHGLALASEGGVARGLVEVRFDSVPGGGLDGKEGETAWPVLTGDGSHEVPTWPVHEEPPVQWERLTRKEHACQHGGSRSG